AHLPLLTDTMNVDVIARMVARELAAACLPTIPIGQSYEHSGFRGSLSFRPETIMAIVRDLADELERQHFTRLVILNGHGGNFALPTVVRDINRMDRPIKVLLLHWGGYDRSGRRDAAGAAGEVHAGFWETSVTMATFPDRVGTPVEPPPNPIPEATQPDLNHYGLGVIRPAGPWGDPTKATAEAGREILASVRVHLLEAIRQRLRWFDEHPRYAGEGPILLRPMVAADIPAGERLCRLAGWNQRADDWALFLRLAPDGCFVAARNGRVVGTVTAVSYDDAIGWVGMLLVDPAVRRRGVGTMLLDRAVHALAGCEVIKLDATPAGKRVYDGMGFTDAYGLRRMTISTAPPLAATGEPSVRAMRSDDLPAVIAMDRAVFGADRRGLIEGLYAMAPHLAHVIIDEEGDVTGFVLGRPGADYQHVGPIAASGLPAAQGLTRAALAAAGGDPVVVDAAGSHDGWTGWLDSLGFTTQRPFIRMFKGPTGHTGDPARQFAVAGPEWG
ncbi:MAG: GNAT family N-acetyltransferase, partial [Planctomycetota bacterium]